MPDAGLVAAVGKRGWATGTAQIVAGHGCGTEVHLGERAGKAQAAGEAQPDSLLGESKGRGWGAGTACVGRKGDKRALVPTVSLQRKPKTFSHLPWWWQGAESQEDNQRARVSIKTIARPEKKEENERERRAKQRW